ncbi:TetR/AcrR family transcriptional regulator [Streptomyces sp.]|uniref:TetR/AcrR family transcriptional regulator n=1 Tax=Streptomyces sp. TaxID=1931 RepID=UPI002F93FC3E
MRDGEQRLGRPRDARIGEAVVAATRELLAERGYAGLTVDAVAARAGVGKAAIYRRFETKQEMAFAAVVHDLTLPPSRDTGSLAGDLAVLLGEIVASTAAPAPRAVLPAILVEMDADAALADRFRRTFLAREQAGIRALLERAVVRGELAGLPDVELAHALLAGPVFACVFLLGRAEAGASRELVAALVPPVAAALAALAAS